MNKGKKRFFWIYYFLFALPFFLFFFFKGDRNPTIKDENILFSDETYQLKILERITKETFSYEKFEVIGQVILDLDFDNESFLLSINAPKYSFENSSGDVVSFSEFHIEDISFHHKKIGDSIIWESTFNGSNFVISFTSTEFYPLDSSYQDQMGNLVVFQKMNVDDYNQILDQISKIEIHDQLYYMAEKAEYSCIMIHQ